MFQKNSLASRIVLVFALTSMVAETARAGITDISNVPLATAGGTTILPNLLFDLDDSGSMDWDFMPDYVSPQTPGVALTQSVPCMKNSGGGTDCAAGDPPFRAGGANGFNGVAYDPNFYYRAGIGQNGQPLLNPPSGLPLGSSVSTTSVPDDVYSHNPYGSSTTNVNLATQIPDRNYCNSNSVCKRNGADTSGVLVSGTAYFDASNGANSGSSFAVSAGQFPYRTNPSNASTAIFGLPEMMSIGSFSRSSSTVTVTTVEPHGLAVNDWIYVTGTGTGSVDLTAVRVATVPSTTSFTYASTSSGTMNATNGFYRKHASATFTQSGTTVTVTSTNHGLVTNDVIAANSSTTSANGTGRTITVVDANTFRYTSATSATVSSSTAMTWVRTGLYNVGSAANGPAIAYAIVPVEYCSDPNLTNCARVLPGNTPPSGFTIPAYVRFCQTQAQALSPTAIGDASGTPRCRSKYNETAGIPKYTYPRYGWFKRDTITSSVTSYSNRPNRPDCAAAPTCTYAEELNNYARWYTYYRTRIQMMKSSVGLAFLSFIGNPTGTPPKPNSIRLGLITMHAQDSGSVSSSKYLRIADFDTTQAASFYDKFYRQRAANATPLQEALARAGWIFAGKLNTGLTSGIPTSDDPIQAACQRNFTLLTTDGYWNNLSSYPPKTPNGKTIGNLDQTPQNLLGNVLIDRSTTGTLDGTGSSGTTFTPTSTQSEQVVCQGNLQANFTIGGPTACGCQPTEHAVIQQDVQTGTLDTYSNGVLQSSTTTTNQFFTNVTGCVTADWTQADTPQTVTEDQSCRRGTNGSNAVFSDGSTNSCGACSTSARYLVIRQVKSQTQTIVTADGVQTRNNVSGTTTSYLYSTDGSTFSSTKPTGTSCATSAPTITLSPNPQTATGATTNTSGTGTAVAVWSPNPQTITGGTATTTFSGAGTASTVADVATYYFQTKLRGGTDVYGDPTGPKFSPNTNPPNTVDLSGDDVPVKTGARDFIPYQHMVTFGIGLADGLMRWQSDYDTANNGDFFNIKSGTVDGCFWATGSCNWPAPANNTSANLDDLWHAAVNGRGTYSQALNADALSRGISTALTALSSTVASAAASATSSPNVTQTDNQIFSTTYETNTWSGKVFAQTIDPTTGNVNPTIQWQADQNLLSKVGSTSDSRTIYTFDSSVTSTTHIKPFTWTSLTGTEQGYFSNKCTPLSTMSQCGGLTATQLTTANDGSQLLGYLRGWQAEEGGAFRDRTFIDPITGATASTVLGDTISAKPVFVRNPTLSYNDAVTPTYGNYATTNAGRSPRVYVAANDGYLHAFNGNTGDEVWAYVPGFLLPGMYALADTNYAVQHRFYVDGSPEAFDVYDATASAWKTIVIGGAGGGGRGFYALDVTDPSNPKGLWEFCSDPTLCNITDSDLGLGYGNPIVGKRKIDGKWVVVLSSGLNNVSPGTGIGYFYVLNVITGQLLDKVSTGVGDTATPSGLMKISAFYDSPATDATFQFVYGTDQLGNVWRLDVGGQSGSPQCAAPASSSATAPCVTHVATLKDAAGGRTQPITTRPALTHISANRVLYIGTGRYLGDGTHGGLSDLVDPGAASGVAWQQTFYGFKDKDVDYGDLRATANLVTQTLTKISTTDRGITNNPVDWSTQDGWLVDFDPIADPSPGERVNIDPRLVLGTLKVVTNIPAGGGACAVGGSSRVYDFDFRTGSAIATAPGGVVGSSLGGTIAVGMAIVQLPSGAIKDIITGADTSKTTVNVQLGAGGSTMRRFSYRER